MFFYAARQPILTKDKQLFAYELLFRDSIQNVFPNIDADEATTKIIEASNFNSGINNFSGNKPAFINFTLDTLTKGYPETLNPAEVVIEILESVKPSTHLLRLCRDLHSKGYTIALDDYIHDDIWRYFFPFIQIIKVDWQDVTLDTIHKIKSSIVDYPHIKLLAEKVETHEEYNAALELGFELFQGFFFAKPEMVKKKSLSPSQMAVTLLLKETSQPDLNYKKITEIFERDVTLSYKLLRYVNSPVFRRRNEVSSINQAIVILGSKELRRFLGLMFAANINPNKPSELINTAMIRAKFFELVCSSLDAPKVTEIAFLVGLLSLIDAILDEEIKVILDYLPLTSDVKTALLEKQGIIGRLIDLVTAIEHADWVNAGIIIPTLRLESQSTLALYQTAVTWVDDITRHYYPEKCAAN